MDIIVAITGASGAIYGIRALEFLKELGVNTHLIISKSALLTIKSETTYSKEAIENLASVNYNINDISASIASGSFQTKGMIIAPCSINTMSSIANSISNNLITRSADVVLKERRKLVLMLRETPLHLGHIENMKRIAEIGGIIAPPVPAFYNNPANLDDIINHSVSRVLDLFDIDTGKIKRWQGL